MLRSRKEDCFTGSKICFFNLMKGIGTMMSDIGSRIYVRCVSTSIENVRTKCTSSDNEL